MKKTSVWKLLGMIFLPVLVIAAVAGGSAYWYFHGSYESEEKNLDVKANQQIDDIAENHSFSSDLDDKGLYDTYVFPSPLAATYDDPSNKAVATTAVENPQPTKYKESYVTGTTLVVDEDTKSEEPYCTVTDGDTSVMYSFYFVSSDSLNKSNGFTLTLNDTYGIYLSNQSFYARFMGLVKMKMYLKYQGGDNLYYSSYEGTVGTYDSYYSLKNIASIKTITIIDSTDADSHVDVTVGGDYAYAVDSDGKRTKAYKSDGGYNIYSYDLKEDNTYGEKDVWSNGLTYVKGSDGVWTATSSDGVTHYWDGTTNANAYTYATTASDGTYLNPKDWYDAVKYPGSVDDGCYWVSGDSKDKCYQYVSKQANCLKAEDLSSLGSPVSSKGYKFCGYTTDKAVAEDNWNSLSSTPSLGDAGVVDLYDPTKPFSEYDDDDGHVDNTIYMYPLFLNSGDYSITVGEETSYLVANSSGLYHRTCMVLTDSVKEANSIKVNNTAFSDVFTNLNSGDMYNIYVCTDTSKLSQKNVIYSSTSGGVTLAIEKVYATRVLDYCTSGTLTYEDSPGTNYQSTGVTYSGGTFKEVMTTNEILVTNADRLQFVINYGENYDSSIAVRDSSATSGTYLCQGYDEDGNLKTYTNENNANIYYLYEGNIVDPTSDSSVASINAQNLPVFKFAGRGVYKLRIEIIYTSGKPSSIKVSAARVRGCFVELHIRNTADSFNIIGETGFIDHSMSNPGSNTTIYRAYFNYGDSWVFSSDVNFYPVKSDGTNNTSAGKTLAAIFSDLLTSSNELYDHVTDSDLKITSSGIFQKEEGSTTYTDMSSGFTMNKNYVFYCHSS